MTAKTILEEAKLLDAEQRAWIISELSATLEAQEPFPLSEAWKVEIQRRYNEYLKDPSKVKTWDEVKTSVKARMK